MWWTNFSRRALMRREKFEML
ncbi:hypothetical protein CSPAE12_05543 [Colletotrichum incanum]|nr:hypothetical protein CSPAE12_05543 [Colletotrichum incanum]